MNSRLRQAAVDTHQWDGRRTDAVTAWLGETAHSWDGDQLVIHNTDDQDSEPEMRPRPGWTLVRWPDGVVTVTSPRSTARLFEQDDSVQPLVDRPFRSFRQKPELT